MWVALNTVFAGAARMNIDDRDLPQAADLLVDQARIVGRVHRVVEMGDALSGHPRQRNRRLTVMQRRRCQDATDRDLPVGHIQMQLVSDPCFLVTLAVLLAACVRGSRQIVQHWLQRHPGLALQSRRLRRSFLLEESVNSLASN